MFNNFKSAVFHNSGDNYFILYCATVNDGKLDQASGYGHGIKPVFLVASFPLL